MIHLQVLQERYGVALDDALRTRLSGSINNTFAGMMQYQFGYVDENLQPRLSDGGKRFRPLLCLLACEACGGVWRDGLSTAAAIELLHNFSLIHDDIEDHDPSRRHRPTVWKLWGIPQGINVGDAVYAEAMRAVAASHTSAEAAIEVARQFGDAALLLTEGQYLDMSFETRPDVTPDEYLAMIERKTGALVSFSVWSGARIAEAAGRTSEDLKKFGLALGAAFQMQDDIMGIWGESHVTGKVPAKDLLNRKKTLPILIACERADAAEAEILRDFLERRHEDVDAILAILGRTEARRETEQRLLAHVEAARLYLRDANVLPEHAALLHGVANEVTGQVAAAS